MGGMNEKSNVIKTVLPFIRMAALIICAVLYGKVDVAGDAENGNKVIRIAAVGDRWFDEQDLHAKFTDLFAYANGGIKTEWIRVRSLDDLSAGMEGSGSIDIVMTDERNYEKLVSNQMLLPMDAIAGSDGFGGQLFARSVLDRLKRIGNGTLYGISPAFDVKVLVYNKTLFNRAGQPYPGDTVAWEEVLSLAKAVAKGSVEEQVYGLAPGKGVRCGTAGPKTKQRFFGALD